MKQAGVNSLEKYQLSISFTKVSTAPEAAPIAAETTATGRIKAR